MPETLLAFLAVSIVVICTPGQDTALTVRNTLGGGRRGGIATATGVATRPGDLDACRERRHRRAAERV